MDAFGKCRAEGMWNKEILRFLGSELKFRR